MSAGYEVLRDRVRASLNAAFGQDDGRVLSLDAWRSFRKSEEVRLDVAEMLEVVARASDVLQGLYAHLALKRARRGVDPLSQLRALATRISAEGAAFDTRLFHTSMLWIFKSLGDVHTAYRLPEPCSGAIAFLPFLLHACYDHAHGAPRFVVSRVLWQPDDPPLCPEFPIGTEIVAWNGVPIEQAVLLSAELEEGSNAAHDRALGLQALTVRWLGASFEPEAPWAMVSYLPHGSARVRECQVWWSVYTLKGGPRILVTEQAKGLLFGQPVFSAQVDRAVATASHVVHTYRKLMFVRDEPPIDPQLLATLGQELITSFADFTGRQELRQFGREHTRFIAPRDGREIPTLLPLFLTARTFTGAEIVDHADAPVGSRRSLTEKERTLVVGRRFGYLGIRAFPLQDPERSVFRYELRRLLSLLPGDGLIIDVRDNPGGSARNAEESLQFLTPHRVVPLPFRLAATAMAKNVAETADSIFAAYASSLSAALANAADFSAGLPLTPPEYANFAGQHYFGPVVLLTNATSYSAADIFAAGFEDNRIGTIIGVDETTGGGGATTLFYADIARALGIRPLPDGINLQVAVRQCTRVGEHNSGIPLEEIGVTVTNPHRLTRADVVDGTPWSLLLRAARVLAAQPVYDFEAALEPGPPGALVVNARTSGIGRVDFYVDGRPTVCEVENDVARFEFRASGRVALEMRGYAASDTSRLVARAMQHFNFDKELEKRAGHAALDEETGRA